MDQLLSILICPDCKTSLKKSLDRKIYCPRCEQTYPRVNNIHVLFPKKNLKTNVLKFNSDKKIQPKNLIDWKFVSYQYYTRYQKFLKYTKPIIGNNLILDIGCASAPLSYDFKNYLGLDNSLKLVSFVGQYVDKPILLADARCIPLKNQSIPFFVCRNLLEHTTEDIKIIKELKRVSQKGGFFELPCSDQISWTLDPVNLVLKKFRIAPLKAFSYGYGHINMHSLQEWKNNLQKGGFQIVSVQEMGNGLFLNIISFLESLFLSYSDNDFIPAKMVPKNISNMVRELYSVLDKLDPKIVKSWTKIFHVK